MHIFKLYFKIFNKHKGQIIMYISIFIGVLMGFILPNSDKQTAQSFTESTVKYALFDYDNSELSKGISDFLEDNIYTGDTLFDRSVGRTDLYGGNTAELEESLRKLISLDRDYNIYPGHGSVSTIYKQIKFNPYLYGGNI